MPWALQPQIKRTTKYTKNKKERKYFSDSMPSHLPIFVSLATFVAKGSVKILDIGGFPKPRK
jgi:hypothetical protein